MRRSDREVTELCQQLEIISAVIPAASPCMTLRQRLLILSNSALAWNMRMARRCCIFTAQQTRYLRVIRQDARVSFFMSCGHALVYDEAHQMCTMNYESVSGQGIMRMLSGSEALHGLDVLMAHYYPDAHKGYDARTAAVTAVYGLEIRSMTAKKREKKV